MTRLSVNINKIATLRNARGGNNPDVEKVAVDCELFGAQGITIHPRPDERHIRHDDVYKLKPLIKSEFNIEGYPSQEFIKLVTDVCPTQVTLVPDNPEQLTSNHGWDTINNLDFLVNVIQQFKVKGIRTSIFVNPDKELIKAAAQAGADRVELYTEPYATKYNIDRNIAIKDFKEAGAYAKQIGLGLNAGHDLSLENLKFFHEQMPYVDEVSIGHALICDALYFGLEDTIHRYLECLL